MKPTLIVLTLGMLTFALTACGRSPEREAARAEARLAELEQEFNELGDDATWQEVGKILDEAAEVANRPATAETMRAARRELAELEAAWDEVLVHVAAADEVIEREGYMHWGLNLEQAQQRRARQIAQHEKNLDQGTESAVTSARQVIAMNLDSARRRIERAQEIIARPARAAAQREQALRELAKLQQLFEQFNALEREIRDAHTDPLQKHRADVNLRSNEYRRSQDVAAAQENLGSGQQGLVTRATNWIERSLDTAPQELEELRRQLDELRAGGDH